MRFDANITTERETMMYDVSISPRVSFMRETQYTISINLCFLDRETIFPHQVIKCLIFTSRLLIHDFG